MAKIEVAPSTASRLTLLASAWETTIDGAIGRLIDRLAAQPPSAAVEPSTTEGQVAVHAVYEGQRSDGLFDPATQSLRITAGPGAGKSFRRPSGAAIAVVQAVNPAVNPNRNGWSFWIVSSNGQALQTIRGKS